MKKILRDNKGSISALVVISVLLYSIVLTTAYMKASGKRRIQIQSQILAKEAYEKQFNNLDEMREEIEQTTLVEAYDSGKIKIGDYVDYKPVEGVTYTSKIDENGWSDQTYIVDTNTTWRVLGKEDDHILLIAGSPIKKDINASSTNEWDKSPYLYMKGAYSYVNCKTILNNICSIYSNSYGTARSITIDDVNKACGVVVEGNTVYLESDASKTNIDVWKLDGGTYTYKSSDYTPDSYINGKKNAVAGQTVNATVGYCYDITKMQNKNIGNTTLGSLLFDKTTNSENYAKQYWISSTILRTYAAFYDCGPGNINDVCASGYALFDSQGNWSAYRAAVRPVISLKSDITTGEVKKLKDQNIIEDEWNGYSTTWSVNGDSSNGEAGNHGD